MGTNNDVQHPATLETGQLKESAKSIAKHFTDKDWDDLSPDMQIKAYELAIEREKARMLYEIAHSIEKASNNIKNVL